MSAPLLELRGVARRFVARRDVFGRATATVKAVDGVDLALRAGETLALVGESGCGKSTVGRLALRLIEPSEGVVRFEGSDLASLGERGLRGFRRHAQLIFQDPYASLNPRMTVGDMLAEPLALHDIAASGQRAARVGDLLSLVGLRPEFAQRYAHEFSGGQRQRIAIARAIAVEPKLIVCDEPVSALDVSIRAQVINLLRDLQKRLGLAYVFISHDLAVVKHIADRVAVMYLGRIVELADTETLFADPRHPYTRALLSAIPVPEPGLRRNRRILDGDVPSPIDPPPGCHLHTRCPHAVDQCRRDRPALETVTPGREVACHLWRDLPPARDSLPRESAPDPVLAKLQAAFVAAGSVA